MKNLSILLASTKLFLLFAPFYPLLRYFFVAKLGIPSAIAGSWIDILALLQAGLCIRSLAKKDLQSWVTYSLVLYCLVGLVVATVSVLLGANMLHTFYGVRLSYVPALFYFVGLVLSKGGGKVVLSLISISALSIALLALSGILLSFFFTSFWVGIYLSGFSDDRGWGLSAIAREGGLRLTGAIMDPVVFGAMCSIGLVILCALMIRFRKYRNPLYLTCFCICSFCLIASLSRGSWLTAFVGLLIVLTLLTSAKTRLLAGLIAMLLFVFALALPLDLSSSFASYDSNSILLRTVQKTIREGNDQRIDQYESGLESLWKNPLGVGPSLSGHTGARFAGTGYQPELIGGSFITDMWYLKLAKEGGLLLLVSFCFFQTCLIASLCAQLVLHSCERYLPALSTAVFAGVALQSLFSNVWDLYFLSQFLWLLAGLSVGHSYNSKLC